MLVYFWTIKPIWRKVMDLTLIESARIVSVALAHLGLKRTETFKCHHFVFRVFDRVSITLPLVPGESLPDTLRVSRQAIENGRIPLGHPIFFIDTREQEQPWHHVGILLSDQRLVHNTHHFGKRVAVTPLSKMWRRYQLIS